MKFKNWFSIILIVILGIGLIACGPGKAKKESILDTPESHYNAGRESLNRGDLDNAIRSLERAIKLDPDFAEAHGWLGVALVEKGDMDNAKRHIDRSFVVTQRKEEKNATAYYARGRYNFAKSEFKDAASDFKTSIGDSKDKKFIDAYGWRAKALTMLGEFDDAEEVARKGLEIDRDSMLLDNVMKEISEFQRATVGMTKETKAIARLSAITRADVAVLFAGELPLDRIFRQAPSTQQTAFAPPGAQPAGAAPAVPQIAKDIPNDFWAAAFIDKALKAGIMEQFPDGTFKPTDKISKANFAMFIQSFLAKAENNPKLETSFIGGGSGFPDVPNTHWAFNAVMVVTTRGLMKAKTDGTFGLMDPVSGKDAVLMIRPLKNQFK